MMILVKEVIEMTMAGRNANMVRTIMIRKGRENDSESGPKLI
jgi:hypothetical protein